MRVALVGNQNSGKTTLFNLLTGLNQKIGNWPGVTIERKSGIIKGTNYELTDLPGIYSLYPYTLEEKISRDFLLNERPDVIINIVDATSIERGLYLTTELLELDSRVIIALNMADRLGKKGLKIDTSKLKEKLGVDVYLISALKGNGINELIEGIHLNTYKKNSKVNFFSRDIEEVISDLCLRSGNDRNKRYNALEILQYSNINSICLIRQKIINKYNMAIDEVLITSRYDFISNICKECIVKFKMRKSINDKLDKIFLNKILSIPIFVCIIFLIYYISIGIVGKNAINLVENFISNIKLFVSSLMTNIGVSSWIISLVCNGIITGVGGVLSFLPQLIILFLCISFLEATGYMSRIAFLLDRLFRKIGLSGKALIPFIIGTGCSVPGIMSSRIMEDIYDRKVTAVITPFIPCSAKLPIIALFTGYFFRDNYALIATSFYFISIILIIISSLIIKKAFNKNYTSSYISELPEFKLPSFRYLFKDVLDKMKEFVIKAGTIIFLSSVLIWFLLSFSTNFEYGVNIQNSILAFLGRKISWFFYPIVGRNSWEISVSAIQGLIAKEQVVSSMEIISGLSGEFRNTFEIFADGSPFSFLNNSSSYAFVIFNLFSAPCIAAIATMKKELGNFKYTFLAIIFQIFLAWIVSVLFLYIIKIFI